MNETINKYNEIFNRERSLVYRKIDNIEAQFGFSIDREKIETAARILACPLKVNRPHWQHGRVIYAALRSYLSKKENENVTILDIGTAKGFSALCAQWALNDSGVEGKVYSVDVIDPGARMLRNSIIEVDGPKTLADYLQPWPEANNILFIRSSGVDWLKQNADRINFAFVDGKHSYEQVAEEASLISSTQKAGDMIMFDDTHMPMVVKAVYAFIEKENYERKEYRILEERGYMITTKV